MSDGLDHERFQRTIAQTIAEEDFSAEGLRRRVNASTSLGPAGLRDLHDSAPPLLGAPGLVEEGGGSESRYVVGGVVGAGATGEVFVVEDRTIAREVAMKLLRPGRGDDVQGRRRFIQEARITARLEHPGIVPIYDLGYTADGRLYYAMRRIAGASLGQALDHPASAPYADLASTNGVVSIFLKICETIGFAHSRGIVHQDLKPDNIMLGAYGEVLIVDWGTSSLVSGDDPGGARQRLVGTPAYLSPEQARCEQVDPRSDVWCLGATLFHVLFGRYPLPAESPEAFWEGKRAGRIAEPTPAEVAGIPPALVAIVRRCLRPDPDQRYAEMSALAADLRAFQAGLAVSAHRDTLVAFLGRLYRRQRVAVWAAILALGVLVGAGAVLRRWQLQEIAGWGDPVVSEDFGDGEAWRERWLRKGGDGEVDDGRLVTTTSDEFFILHPQPFAGGVAIEFEGEMLPGSPPCDLSVVWCEGFRDSESPWRINDLVHPFLLQVGAYSNSLTMILDSDRKSAVDSNPLRLENGRRYRVRGEIDGARIALFVDGQQLCSYDAPFPLTGGYIGIYGYGTGKAFDQVRIYARGVAERIPVTGRGDALYRAGHKRDAILAYEEVLRSHGDLPIGDEARFKAGLCSFELDDQAAAQRMWTGLRDTLRQARARLLLLDHALAEGADCGAILTELETLSRQGTNLRRLALEQWARGLGSLRRQGRERDIDRFLDLRERLFADEELLHFDLADLYLARGWSTRLLSECPDMHWARAIALQNLGRPEEVLSFYPDTPWISALALVNAGQDEAALSRFPGEKPAKAAALMNLRRFTQVITDLPGQAEEMARSRIALGRWSEVADDVTAPVAWRLAALHQLGRLDQAAEHFGEDGLAADLLARYRYEEVLARLPSHPAAIQALAQLGRWDEAIRRRGDDMGFDAACLAWSGIGLEGQDRWRQGWAEALRAEGEGRNQDILDRFVDCESVYIACLNRLGRGEEVLRRWHGRREACARALLHLDRPEEVIAGYGDQIAEATKARALLGLRRLRDGDIAAGLAEVMAAAAHREADHPLRLVGVLVRAWSEPTAWRATMGDELARRGDGCFQMLWHDVAWLVGSIDDATFRAQPVVLGVEERLVLVRALRADLEGSDEAARHWQAWDAQPHSRFRADPVLRAFLAWRRHPR